MRKKFVAVLLACALAVGTVSGPVGIETVQAEETENGILYQIETGGVTITGYTGSQTELVIPDSIKGVEVTGIGDSAFAGCSGLTSINLPEGVTSIGARAFSYSGLTSINLPEGVTSIGYYIFSSF